MIFILPDYTVAWANHAFCEILGKNQDEIVGRPCYEIIWGRKQPCDLCLIPQVRKTGKLTTKETTFQDGRIFEIDTYPVYDDAGTITGYIEQGRDISEVKKARQKIQEQKNELQLTVNATVDGIWKWNFVTDEIWFSPRYYEMLGYEPDAFPADYDHWADLLHPDDRESAVSVAEDYLGQKTDRYENEFRMRTKDGTYRWIHVIAKVVEWAPDGTAVRMIGNHEDITNLREQETKYRMVFNTARDMIYLHEICDDGSPGRILDANEEACRAMGYSLEEMKTLQVTDINDPDYETDLSEVISASRKRGEYLREWQFVTKTGQYIPVEISFRAFQMDGQRIGVAVVRNVSDRKEAEKTLHEEEEKYRRLFEESNDAIFLHQSDGSILDTNAAAADLLGYTRDEFREMNVADLSPGEALNACELALTITQQDHAARFEMVFKQHDGSQIPVEISSRVIDPDLMLIQGIVRDISERKAYEKEILALKSFYESLFERIPDGIWTTDSSDTVTYASPGMERIAGTAVDEIVGRQMQTGFNEPATKEFWPEYQRAKQAGEPTEYQVRVTTPAGRLTWQAGWLVPRCDTTGRSNGMIVTTRDITQQVELDEQLALTRFSVEHLPEAIFWIERDGSFFYVNDAAVGELGYSREELMKLRVDDINPNYPFERREEVWKELSENQLVCKQTNHRRKDGTTLPVEVISGMVTVGGKELEVAIARDMTEHQQTEAALMLANKKVSLLNSITRHDIINLITAQMLYLDLLRQTSDSRKQAEYLDTLETITERIEHNIIFTRDYQNLGTDAPVWQNPETIIKAEWSTYHGTEPVRLEVATGNLEIFADRMLSKVIGNLIDNAFKHAGTITCLTFRTEERGSEMALICEDDGVGISPEKKDLLFQQVFNKKHGYGLYLISEILAITGMTITEEGTPSKGARFVILIPEGVWREKQDQKAADNQ